MVAVGANLYRGGWFALRIDDLGGPATAGAYPDADALVDAWDDASLVLLGVPIGLPDARRPTRQVDREARRALGAPRHSSVFPVPSRDAVEAFRSGHARGYQALSDLNQRALGKRLSRQSAALLHKIAEVDQLLSAGAGVDGRRRVREAHRELCFWGLGGRRPMAHPKTTPEGVAERLGVLGAYLPWAHEFVSGLERESKPPVPPAVSLDALATALTARGHPRLGGLSSLPAEPEVDARGLPLEMVYRLPRLPQDAGVG